MPQGDIVHIELYSTDFEKFKKFYAPFNWRFTDWGEEYMLFMPPNEQGVGGGIVKSTEPKPNQNHWFYIFVDSIEEMAPKLKEIGWTIKSEKTFIADDVGSFIVVSDFDGVTNCLLEGPKKKE